MGVGGFGGWGSGRGAWVPGYQDCGLGVGGDKKLIAFVLFYKILYIVLLNNI